MAAEHRGFFQKLMLSDSDEIFYSD